MKKSAIIMSIALMLGMFTPAIATENLPGPPETKQITLELPKDKSKQQQMELPSAPVPAATNEDAEAAQHRHGGGVIIISGTTLLIILILLILLL